MAQTPREQSRKTNPKTNSQTDAKKSDKVRVERFGDKGLDYITLDKKPAKGKK